MPEFRKALRLTREILAQPAFDDYRGHEIQPGDDQITDDQLMPSSALMLNQLITHAALQDGDASDPMAVVASDTSVIGFENLYCADSSIFPRITNGNLNAPLHHDWRESI